MRYFERIGDRYVQTDRRPPAAVDEDLRREIRLRTTSKHKPGDGWHYIPASPAIVFSGSYWFPDVPSSEGCVLAHVWQICSLYGIDYKSLYQAAYPNEPCLPPGHWDFYWLERDATRKDARAVLRDLEQINYPNLADLLSKWLGVDY